MESEFFFNQKIFFSMCSWNAPWWLFLMKNFNFQNWMTRKILTNYFPTGFSKMRKVLFLLNHWPELNSEGTLLSQNFEFESQMCAWNLSKVKECREIGHYSFLRRRTVRLYYTYELRCINILPRSNRYNSWTTTTM